MLLSDIMIRNPVTARADSRIGDLVDKMRRNNIRHLPIIGRDGAVVGMVSDRDLKEVYPWSGEKVSVWELMGLLEEIRANSVMGHPVVTLPSSTPVELAAETMAAHRFHSLPVVDDGKLVGLVTQTDLFVALVKLLRPIPAGGP